MRKFLSRTAAFAVAGAIALASTPQAAALSSGSSMLGYLSSANPVAPIVDGLATHLPSDLEGKKQALLEASEYCLEEQGNTVVQNSPVALDLAERTAAGEFTTSFIYQNFRQVHSTGYSGMIIQLTDKQVDEYIKSNLECSSGVGVIQSAASAVTHDRQYVYLIRLSGNKEVLSGI